MHCYWKNVTFFNFFYFSLIYEDVCWNVSYAAGVCCLSYQDWAMSALVCILKVLPWKYITVIYLPRPRIKTAAPMLPTTIFYSDILPINMFDRLARQVILGNYEGFSLWPLQVTKELRLTWTHCFVLTVDSLDAAFVVFAVWFYPKNQTPHLIGALHI